MDNVEINRSSITKARSIKPRDKIKEFLLNQRKISYLFILLNENTNRVGSIPMLYALMKEGSIIIPKFKPLHLSLLLKGSLDNLLKTQKLSIKAVFL